MGLKIPQKMVPRRATLHAKAVSKDGIVEFTASTPNVDRAGDVIDPVWDLKAFERNPVILWAHDYNAYPIGKATKVWTENGNLKIAVKFVPEDIYPEADRVRKLYEAGFLSAVSVGFRPLEEPLRRPEGGYRIPKSELLEVSAVPVPMNAEALITSKGANMRPVFSEKVKRDPLKGADPDRITAWLKEGPKTMDLKTIDLAELGAALNTTTVNTTATGMVVAATKTGTGNGAGFIYVKADEPPPAADAEKPMDCGAVCAEVLKLLTPVDGKIEQSAFDKAIAMLKEHGGEEKDEGEGDDAPADDAKADDDMPPAKALLSAVRELTQAVKGLKQDNADPFDLDQDDPIADAFADPDVLAKLGRELG